MLLAMSLLVALSGHNDDFRWCKFSGVKRTFGNATAMSANDPEQPLVTDFVITIFDLPATLG
jgi:hypothetical protein